MDCLANYFYARLQNKKELQKAQKEIQEEMLQANSTEEKISPNCFITMKKNNNDYEKLIVIKKRGNEEIIA